MYLLSGLAKSSLGPSRPALALSLRLSPRHLCSTMAGDGNSAPGGPAAEKKKATKDEGMREVRILMLHGYTQSGPLFRSKTRALEKLLAKSLAPSHLKPVLLYPTAPNALSAKDIPGYQPPADDSSPDEPDAWAWFRKDEATSTYRLLPEGMHHVASHIAASTNGAGVDGVIGFSQGGFMAATVAAALEHPHRTPPPADAAWVEALRAANGGRALRFAVVYSGFFAPQPELAWLYAPAPIATPSLHFLGSLDTVVSEERSMGLVERCEEAARTVVVHPGGHHVPVAREWVGPLVGFIRKFVAEKGGESERL